MMNNKGMRGMLFMAATMAAMGESVFKADEETSKFKSRARKLKLQSKSILTPKQLKVRNKEKRAKLARKINR